jgi:hypothetical protein
MAPLAVLRAVLHSNNWKHKTVRYITVGGRGLHVPINMVAVDGS